MSLNGRGEPVVGPVTQRRNTTQIFFSATLLLFCAFVIGLSIHQTLVSYRFGNVLATARRVQDGTSLSLSTLERVRPELDAVRISKLCRSDIVKSGVVITTAYLDAKASSDGPLSTEDLLASSQLLSDSLSCFPSDGDLWLRYGMIRQTLGDTPDAVAAILSHSQMLSPTEPGTLLVRFLLWNRLPADFRTQHKTVMDADLKTVCAPKAAPIRKNLIDENLLSKDLIAAKTGNCI
jgi:hypothetical protein